MFGDRAERVDFTRFHGIIIHQQISHNLIAHPTPAALSPTPQILASLVIGQPFPVPCRSENILEIAKNAKEEGSRGNFEYLGKEYEVGSVNITS